MNNYINKQTAIDTLIKEANEYGACGYVDAFNIEKTLNNIPAVEVIRCKDCKSFSHGYCKFHDAKFVREDGYCYWGERKNDE